MAFPALVVLLGGAIWLEYYKQWLPLVVIVAVDRAPVAPALIVGPGRSADGPQRAHRPAQYRPGGQMAPGLRRGGRAPAGAAVRPADRRAEARCSGPKPRSPIRSRTRAPASTGLRASSSAPARHRLLGPNDRLLTGGIAVASRDGMHVDGAANSIFALAPGGTIIGRYDKAHLVPYGEYLPMRPLLSAIGLSRLAPGDLDFTSAPARARSISAANGAKSAFSSATRSSSPATSSTRSNRPDFIFNPSNDAWFGRWGPPQHLAQARLRAAEEGLPVIRATPTGISAVIDARGNS